MRIARTLARRLAAALLGIAALMPAARADYPERALQMVIPFPAGGPADIVGRLYAQHLAVLLGQPVSVLNRDGAAGVIGTDAVARSAPDGYSLIFGTTSTMAINPIIMKNLPYDFHRDFALVSLIANAPHILAVRDGLPARTAPELIALAKKSPGKYTFASAGLGTIVQMGGELFKHEAAIDILHVPYKGGGPATLALLSGEVDMTVNDLTTLKANLAAGKLRALGVAHTSRLKPLPEVPTFPEMGMPRIVSSTWWGVAVPVKTPESVVSRLKAASSRIVAEPDYVARLAAMAVEPLVLGPEQSAAFIAAEIQKWKRVAAAAGVKLD